MQVQKKEIDAITFPYVRGPVGSVYDVYIHRRSNLKE